MKKMPDSCFKKTFLILVTIGLLPLLTGLDTMVDPTRPPGVITSPTANTTTAQPLELTAVFIYPSYRMAIIGNQKAMISDHIGEFIVTNILPYTVELTGQQNNKVILQLAAPVKQAK